MLNKSRIENNPYRILGVYVGSPLSVEVNHLNKIRAFSKVGQTASFNLRGDNLLQPILRTEELADKAAQTLSLAKDRLENAILWFSDDETEWGRILNCAVEGLIDGDITKAINSYDRLLSNDMLRAEFLSSVTHGLLTMPKEELAILISELILSIEGDMEGFWMSEGPKPSGRIAKILFEKTMSVKVERLIQSIDNYNKYSCHDFYEGIEELNNALCKAKPMLEKIANMYGSGSIQYKNIAEEFCRKIYARGTFLITEIGKFVWLQKPKNRLNDNSYKKYKSKMPIGCIMACMDLMRRVDNIVNDAINWTKIDDTSKRILYTEIANYQSVKRIELVDNNDVIHKSIRSFYIKKGILIAGWVAFIYWVFWIA